MTLRAQWELDNHTLKYIAGNNDFKELMDICSWGSSGAVVTPDLCFPSSKRSELQTNLS